MITLHLNSKQWELMVEPEVGAAAVHNLLVLERRLVALETAFSTKGHGKGLLVQERMEARIWQLQTLVRLK